MDHEGHDVIYHPHTASALLYSIAHLQHLRHLRLDIEPDGIQLFCPISLPQLIVVVLFSLGDECSEMDLSWLQHQPCSLLEVNVCVVTTVPALHRQCIRELQQLADARLSLLLPLGLPTELKDLWESLKPVRLRYRDW